jgi:hypothetical protein
MERYDCESEQFKAIFAQRGKAVDVNKLDKGSFYLSAAFKDNYSCIFEYVEKEFLDEKTIVAGHILVETGAYWQSGDIDAVTVYEATEDQIELLNAYKF